MDPSTLCQGRLELPLLGRESFLADLRQDRHEDFPAYPVQVLGGENTIEQVSGLLQNGRYQSRQFVPCYTKDEFLANMLEEQGVNQALFARIAVALFKKPAKSNESEQEEKLIAELEKMVDQYEAALQNKEEK